MTARRQVQSLWSSLRVLRAFTEREPPDEGPTIAILFLVRDVLPAARQRDWTPFLHDARFCFVAHTWPRVQLKLISPLWQERLRVIEHPVATAWGATSITAAHFLLMKTAAARFPSVRFFMLVSESCAPIQTPNYVAQVLEAANGSFFGPEDMQHRHRVPADVGDKGVKHPTWVGIHRNTLKELFASASNDQIFAWLRRIATFHTPCKDEHWGTMIKALNERLWRTSCLSERILTAVDWSRASADDAHPRVYFSNLDQVRQDLADVCARRRDGYLFIRKVAPEVWLSVCDQK